MGALAHWKMRSIVYFGLFVLAVALIAEDASAISFDDLVAQAEEARHPKPKVKKEAPRPDPEMEEWSTDHLLGLDQPPPSHMFDSLFDASAATHKVHHHGSSIPHAAVKKAHHKKHVVHKRHHKSHKKLKASTHHHVAKKVHSASHHMHHRESASDFTENLLGSIPAAKHHHDDKMVMHDKDTEGKPSLMLNLDRHHGKTVQMVSTHIEDPAYDEPKEEEPKEEEEHKKEHKRSHKKSHKKHESHHESIMGSLKIPSEDDEADAVVPEAEAEEELLAPHLPRASHHHKHAGPTSLAGLASSMLAESDQQEKAKVDKKKEVKKAQEAADAEEEERESKALGGKKPVHLDLGDDDEDEEEEEGHDDYGDSLSFDLDDDDDDVMLIQLKDGDVDEW